MIGVLIASVIFAGTYARGPSAPVVDVAKVPEFGTQMVGVLSPLQSVVIQNAGSGTLQLSSISTLTMEGSPSGDFVVSLGNCVKSRIEQGESCEIGIGFHPKGVGLRNAKLVLTDNASGSPQSFPLTGTGFLPPHADARSNPVDVDFGTRAVDGKYDSPLAILNDGNASLSIEEIRFDGDAGPFSVIPQTCDHAVVQPKASCQITVTFSPRQAGVYSASLSISHGDTWPLTVPIRGAASGPRLGYCCIQGNIGKGDEDSCAANRGIFSQNLEDLRSRCQSPVKRQISAPVPIQPGTGSMELSQNLYPCNSVVLSWKPVYDPGETVSYTVSLNAYYSALASGGQSPWRPFRGFSPTEAPKLPLPDLFPISSPAGSKAAVLAKPMMAMIKKVQPPEIFRWQVVASDSLGNVSPPSDWRYFRCQAPVIQ